MLETTSTKKEKIINMAISMLLNHPEGIRYSHLKRTINEKFEDIGNSTIGTTIVNLEHETKGLVVKVDKGLFRHRNFVDYINNQNELENISLNRSLKRIGKNKNIKEEMFYLPFSDWLTDEIEECTTAIPLGGNKFRDKWGTPDVIGIRESKRSAIFQFSTEIVSAEIKADTGNLITAFGQACSYKLFSHKSYIVVPKDSSVEDIARLDGLSRIFGIGLILFDNKNSNDPMFEIRVRASKHEPDMFYVDKYMKLIESDLFSYGNKRRV